MLYFSYGSNLNKPHIHERVPSARFLTTAKLSDRRVVFNKKDIEIDGDANIITSPGREVWGALWDMSRSDLYDKLALYEKGYDFNEVRVLAGKDLVSASAFVAAPDTIDNHLRTSQEYREWIISGARDCGLSSDYIYRTFEWAWLIRSVKFTRSAVLGGRTFIGPALDALKMIYQVDDPDLGFEEFLEDLVVRETVNLTWELTDEEKAARILEQILKNGWMEEVKSEIDL